MGVCPKIRLPCWEPNNKDYSILASPYVWKLPYLVAEVNGMLVTNGALPLFARNEGMDPYSRSYNPSIVVSIFCSIIPI